MKSNIPEIMEKNSISVSELSRITGLSRTTITPLSKNAELPKQTRIDTLNKVANALNVTIDSLYENVTSWKVEKYYTITNHLIGSNESHIYLLKCLSDFNNGKKPLFITISFAMGLGIDCEFLNTDDLNQIYYLDQQIFNEINVEALNTDYLFTQSINPKFINSFETQIFTDKLMQSIIKKEVNTIPKSKLNKRDSINFFSINFGTIGKNIINLNNNDFYLSTNMDDLIKSSNNLNIDGIFNNWADNSELGKKAKEKLYHISLDRQ
ncbi:XRE family transcriptional regulator [Companilactobacillus zhachilii]|uniref:XRE family transcriptional regulator n=1 Tax=Companilactobacillus zhachilii TaxID=2304606 RepID=A0A386PPU8_9LACO|nr:helix-turn-helix transcriptional regulator [Companilactobacillus zhachilii]AYE37801.1 XRE family transcriptional regulator [Companilactobacillus zhachilii]